MFCYKGSIYVPCTYLLSRAFQKNGFLFKTKTPNENYLKGNIADIILTNSTKNPKILL